MILDSAPIAANLSDMQKRFCAAVSRASIAASLICPLVILTPASAGENGAAQNTVPNGEVVLCYDPSLGVVQRKLIGDCGGEVVSPERAEKIRQVRVDRRRRILAAPHKPIIEGRQLSGIGTGFFVAPDGKLLTNNHVVEGCSAVSVATPDGRKAEARVVDTQPDDDLALIQAPFVSSSIATFLSPIDLFQDDPITVIGYPDQGLAPIKPLITSGQLGAAGATTDGRPRFRIHADIRRGNSGGPVVDNRALVIGVVYAKIDTVSAFKATGEKIRFVGVVVDNKSVFDFLDRNAVSYRKGEGGRMGGALRARRGDCGRSALGGFCRSAVYPPPAEIKLGSVLSPVSFCAENG